MIFQWYNTKRFTATNIFYFIYDFIIIVPIIIKKKVIVFIFIDVITKILIDHQKEIFFSRILRILTVFSTYYYYLFSQILFFKGMSWHQSLIQSWTQSNFCKFIVLVISTNQKTSFRITISDFMTCINMYHRITINTICWFNSVTLYILSKYSLIYTLTILHFRFCFHYEGTGWKIKKRHYALSFLSSVYLKKLFNFLWKFALSIIFFIRLD